MTGTASREALIERLRAAAGAGDPAGLHALIDWELSAASTLAHALAQLPEAERSDAAARGLADIDACARDAERVRPRLASLYLRLQACQLRAAHDDERRIALAAVRVPPAPAGLAEWQRQRLDALRTRAEYVDEVLVADRGRPPVRSLPVAPGGERVLLVP